MTAIVILASFLTGYLARGYLALLLQRKESRLKRRAF
jgi:hypothetical protein